ncbi:MAG: hypothetical protein WC285_05755 [Candidatus Gracilibacteria bacterium]|jgi:hypothetical protein
MYTIKSRKSGIKKTLFKTVVVFLCGLALIGSTGDFALAVAADVSENYYDTGVYDPNGNLRVGRCIQKGNIDFVAFLQATLWSDSFSESIKEPWKDVLKRNTCHSADMFGLIQQRDEIRKRIRDAFLTCRNDQIQRLQTAYYKIVMEIFFARNVVTAGWVAPQLADMNDLVAQLKSKYVDSYGWLSAGTEFDTFANELKLRYIDRRNAYVNANGECEETSWSDVKEKAKEFFDSTIRGGFVSEIRSGSANIVRRAQKIEQAAKSAGSLKEYAKGLLQVNINNQSPGDFWAEFSAEASENNPFTKTNFPSTTEAVIQSQILSKSIIDQQSLKNEMSARFQALYGSTSDSNLRLFVDEAVKMNKAVTDSFVPLNQVEQSSENMNNRQCGGN